MAKKLTVAQLKSVGKANEDSITIGGKEELLKKLEMLHKSASYRAMKAGSSKAMQVAAKAIKRAVPAKYKEARKAIGWKVGKVKGGINKGVFRSRAGVGVGVKRTKIANAKKSDRRGRKGVNRATRGMQRTGSTKAELPGFASKAIGPAKSQMLAASIRGSWASIRKDVARGKAY